MDTKEQMIIANGKVVTQDVTSCFYNYQTNRYEICFKNGKKYYYNYSSIEWLKNPEALSVSHHRIFYRQQLLTKIAMILRFRTPYEQYYLICFQDGTEKAYPGRELTVEKSGLIDDRSANILKYLNKLAVKIGIIGDDGENLLAKQYEKLKFVGENTVLANYLNPEIRKPCTYQVRDLIFPFGCNAGQYQAVLAAMGNQISVIEGPPGTGKTQTILNIIANLIVTGKTVQIVSYNNSAIANIREKLQQYGFDFIVAFLGNRDNKDNFIAEQPKCYPDLTHWREEKGRELLKEIQKYAVKMPEYYEKKAILAKLKLEQQQIDTEYHYFKDYNRDAGIDTVEIPCKIKSSAQKILSILESCQTASGQNRKIKWRTKVKLRVFCGKSISRLAECDNNSLIVALQNLYYIRKSMELKQEIEQISQYLAKPDIVEAEKAYRELSLRYFKYQLSLKYKSNTQRKQFSHEDLTRNIFDVTKEYPVVLSTTFSARSNVNDIDCFDYIIMDEASQVDVVTGALALSVAQNAVIVGDSKQLPNVISEKDRYLAEAVSQSYPIDDNYNYVEVSFLKSVSQLFPNVPKTLLKEHYRCHPKIINFCNQKFYEGELILMTDDVGEKDVLGVKTSVIGEHARGHINQRQVDIICNEILPSLKCRAEQIGIIAPYRDQVEALTKAVNNSKVDIATVHKFQGREKDVIILSTVDNKPTEFSDDPYLLNVAISRAKKRLILVAPEEAQGMDSNIGDLIAYIRYHRFEISDSHLYSIFDYLYSQYDEQRRAYLKKHRTISEYDSENLMFALICDVLKEQGYNNYGVICRHPLKMLIRNKNLLTEEELRYVQHNSTHLDFLIYSKISKMPVLAIEVDGYWFHKAGTRQDERDQMKNRILEKYGVPYLRFKTNGSGEKEILIQKLHELLS